MNIYDSSRIKILLELHKCLPTDQIDDADIIVLNTCHIREKAAEKVYSDLGRIRKTINKKTTNTIVVVAGCVAQAEGKKIFNRAPWVNIVVGPQSYHTLPELINKISYKDKQLYDLDFKQEEKFDALPTLKTSSPALAYLTIQEGCNKFCKYCIVPYTRGREFSRPLEKIYQEALNLASKGAIEIYLLGQNVNAYKDKSSEKHNSLADLIKKIASIDEVKRIRYMTSHPNDMSEDLIETHGSIEKLMPHLHLPVQSGSDKVLKHMNRRHTAEKYLKVIDKLKKARPDICFSSDMIVGYPEETEEDFQDTLKIIEAVKYSQVYSFKYSPRTGTPAAKMVQIPEEIKNDRLQRLQSLTRTYQENFNKTALNKTFDVLVTNKGKYENQVAGFSPYMHSVAIDDAKKHLGQIVTVKINKILSNSLKGNIVNSHSVNKNIMMEHDSSSQHINV